MEIAHYSANLYYKKMDSSLLIRLTNKYLNANSQSACKTPTDVWDIIFAIQHEWHPGLTPESQWWVQADFDATPHWGLRMRDWFKFVSPAFSPDATLEVFPDVGIIKCWIKDGMVRTAVGGWALIVDLSPGLTKAYNEVLTYITVPDDVKHVIKDELGQYGNLTAISAHRGDTALRGYGAKIEAAYNQWCGLINKKQCKEGK